MAGFIPYIEFASGLLDLLFAGQQALGQQIIDVFVTGTDGAEAAIQLPGHPLQVGYIQLRNHDAAVALFNERAVGQFNGSPIAGADAHNGQGRLITDEIFHFVGKIPRQVIGHQQDAAPIESGLLQGGHCFFDSRYGVIALLRHDVRAQAVDHAENGVGVVGQWRYHMGCGRIHDQCRQTFIGAVENVAEFQARSDQAGGGEVLGVHGKRKVQHNDLGVDFFLHCLGQLLPGGAGHGNHGQ